MTQHHDFAPGVVDGPYRAPRRRLVWRLIDGLAGFLLQHAGLLMAISVVLGILVGYLVPMP